MLHHKIIFRMINHKLKDQFVKNSFHKDVMMKMGAMKIMKIMRLKAHKFGLFVIKVDY
jgi:hypothetical protein